MDDDEIIDAEIVEDLLPAVITPTEILPRNPYPVGAIDIPLSWPQRQIIREALAHFFDNGPRGRNTPVILNTLRWMADNETGAAACGQCDNTGKYRTMYAMEYCYCPRGVERRIAGN